MSGTLTLVILLGFALLIGRGFIRRPAYQRRRAVDLGPSTANGQATSGFKVIYRGSEKPASAIFYDISLGGRKVAEFATDCNGESPEIRKPNGGWIGFDYILEGGGPESLRLSKRGTELIAAFLAGQPLPPMK